MRLLMSLFFGLAFTAVSAEDRRAKCVITHAYDVTGAEAKVKHWDVMVGAEVFIQYGDDRILYRSSGMDYPFEYQTTHRKDDIQSFSKVDEFVTSVIKITNTRCLNYKGDRILYWGILGDNRMVSYRAYCPCDK